MGGLPVELWRLIMNLLLNNLLYPSPKSRLAPARLICLLNARSACQLFRAILDEILEEAAMPERTEWQLQKMRFNPKHGLSYISSRSPSGLALQEKSLRSLLNLPKEGPRHPAAAASPATSILLYGPLGCGGRGLKLRLAKEFSDVGASVYWFCPFELGIGDGDVYTRGIEW